MGGIGSKEKINQLVTIYGYRYRDVPWLELDSRKVYQANGLIITHEGRTYLLTTRSFLIGCEILTAYYCVYYQNKEFIFKNDLEIFFQSVDFNLVLMVSKDKNVFDFYSGQLLTNLAPFPNTNNWKNFEFNSCPILDDILNIPTKKNTYYLIKMNLDLQSETLNFMMDFRDVRYMENTIINESYLPTNLFHRFTIDEKKNSPILNGITGTAIFNKKHKLIGIVGKVINSSGEMLIITSRVIKKFLIDFFSYVNKPNMYIGLCHLPITYKVSNEMIELTTSISIPIGNNKSKLLKKMITSHLLGIRFLSLKIVSFSCLIIFYQN